MSKLNSTLFNHIVDLLVDHVGDTERQRKSLMAPMFSSYENLYNKINWSGAGREFTVHLIEIFNKHGEVEIGQQALVLLLQELRPQVGIGDQRTIDLICYSLETHQTSPSESNNRWRQPETIIEPVSTPSATSPKQEQKSTISKRLVPLLIILTSIVVPVAFYILTTTNRISVIGDIKITPPEPKAGEVVTVEAYILSEKSGKYKLGMTGRGPEACQKDWNDLHVDWPNTNVALESDKIYRYSESRIVEQPGNYFVQIGIINWLNKWHSIVPHPRKQFDILTINGERWHPQCVVIVNSKEKSLSLSAQQVQRGTEVTLTYTIRNDQPESIFLHKLAAQVTLSDTERRLEFPSISNIEIYPNDELTYRKSFRFHNSGEYLIQPSYHEDGKDYQLPIWPYPEIKLIVE